MQHCQDWGHRESRERHLRRKRPPPPQPPAGVLVDLGAVTFLDARGLTTLLAAFHLAADQGIPSRVTNAHDAALLCLRAGGLLDTLSGCVTPGHRGRGRNT
jgi:hypothetical protein